MKPVLIYLQPLDQVTGQRVDVRFADGGSADVYAVGGTPWEPGVLTRPKLSIELMSPDMNGKVQAGQATFDVALGQLMSMPNAIRMYWKGASVVIHNTGALEGSTAIPDFWGYVTSARLDLDTGRLSVTAEVSTALIDKPLLTGQFNGGGGLDGEPAKRGTLFPAGFGTVKNIQPVWFDTTRNIGMIDGYGNTISIDWLGEGLSSFGAAVKDYPTYTALAAGIDNGEVKKGQWATCVAQGLVGLGAPSTGIITVHATFGFNRIGAMMKRILLTHAKVAPARVDSYAFDALDTLVPLPVHYWTATDRNVKDLLEALAQSCNATPLVSFQNLVTVTRAVGGAKAGTLDRSGQIEPRVLDWQSFDNDPPYYLLKARAKRPASVLSDDQVNYVDTLVDQGVYNNATVYRAGNLVWLSDGSQWLYQNSTPSSGHAPPTSAAPDGNGYVQDAWWFRRQPPKTASDFTYQDGTPIQALQPRQAGADPTGSNTAAAILGQGAGATAASKDIFNSFLQILANGTLSGGGGGQVTYGGLGGGALGLLGSLFFGNSLFTESNGGPLASLNNFKTILGVASAISNQGAFATINSAAYGSGLLTGFGALAPLGSLNFGSPFLLESSGGAQATLNAFKTALGISSGITGQSPWATTLIPTTRLTNENANVVYDGGLTLQGARFIVGAGWNWTFGGGGDGPYFARSGNGISVSATDFFPWSPGVTGYLQTEMFNGGMTAGTFGCDMEFWNGATNIPGNGGGVVSAVNGTGWAEYGAAFVSPANTTRARVRFYHSDGTQSTNSAIRKIKVSNASARTKFTDEATVGAAYDDGTYMNLLKPGEFGANVTEGRTAAAIAGQGALATLSQLANGSSFLTGFGTLSGLANLTFGSPYLLESAGVSATNANYKTNQGTAAAISGQGAFATLNNASLTNTGLFSATGRFSALDNGDQNYFNATVMQYGSTAMGYYQSVQSLKPQEVGSNVTETRTASAIAGQSAFATFTGYSPSFVSNRVQKIQDDGNIQASGIYQPGVAFLSDYFPAEAGSNKTELRTAAAISGQSPYATTTLPLSRLTDDSANMLYDGALSLKGARWYRDPAWVWSGGGAGDGPYFATGGSTGASPTVNYSDFIPWAQNSGGYFQAELFAGGVTSGAMAADVEFWNNSGSLGVTGAALTPANGTGWTQYGAPFTAPAGTTRLRVRLFLNANTNNTNAAARRFKVAQSSTRTKFSDEATTGAAYDDGTYMNNLRPGEAGANVTEGRTAAAILGQSQLATAPFGLTPGGGIPVANVDNYGIGRLDAFWPGEGGANKTETRTAAAITGQGSFATISQASLSNTTLFQATDRFASIDNGDQRFFSASGVQYGSQQLGYYQSLQSLKPQEANANVTEGRTSAAIAGQGPFATVAQIAQSNVASFFNFSAFSLNYSITRADGQSIVTENLAITSLGVSSGFVGQAALATLNQVDTGQIAGTAVTNFNSGVFNGQVNTDDSPGFNSPNVSLTSIGSRIRVEAIFDSYRTGQGTNLCIVQLYVLDGSGNAQSTSRQYNMAVTQGGPPNVIVWYVTPPAGAWNFQIRFTSQTGKGSNGFSIASGILAVEEKRR